MKTTSKMEEQFKGWNLNTTKSLASLSPEEVKRDIQTLKEIIHEQKTDKEQVEANLKDLKEVKELLTNSINLHQQHLIELEQLIKPITKVTPQLIQLNEKTKKQNAWIRKMSKLSPEEIQKEANKQEF